MKHFLCGLVLAVCLSSAASAQSTGAPGVKSRDIEAAKSAPKYGGKFAYCYYNEQDQTWRIGNDVIERTIVYDRIIGNLKTTSILNKLKNGVRLGVGGTSEGEFTLVRTNDDGTEETGSPYKLDLASDWEFSWQSVTYPPHGGRALSIHLVGKGKNRGYSLEATYEVFAGNVPFLVKSLMLINRTDGHVKVKEVVYDKVVFVPPYRRPGREATEKPDASPVNPQFKTYTQPGAKREGLSATLMNFDSSTGLMSGVLDPTAKTNYLGGSVVQRLEPAAVLAPKLGKYMGPRAAFAVYNGVEGQGVELYQFFVKSVTSGHAVK